jgi:hypothetical protein
VKNFFISSVRVVGDAPLIEVPLMIVTLSVVPWEKINWEGEGLSSTGSAS